MQLINCEIEIDVSWSKKHVISDISITPWVVGDPDVSPTVQEMVAIQTTGAATAWKVSKYGVFSDPYFPAFGLNMERYFVSLLIQSECGKIRTSCPVVTLSINDNIKFLENVKQVIKRAISWNKYRSEITT